jgi:hypothetical protein
VKRLTVALSNIRLINFNFLGCGKLNLGFFGGVPDSLIGLCIGFKVNRIFFFKFGNNVINYYCVKIVSPKVGITICGFDFNYSIPNFKN